MQYRNSISCPVCGYKLYDERCFNPDCIIGSHTTFGLISETSGKQYTLNAKNGLQEIGKEGETADE